MSNGTPHIWIFFPSPYAYGDSPYAYGDHVLSWLASLVESRTFLVKDCVRMQKKHHRFWARTYMGISTTEKREWHIMFYSANKITVCIRRSEKSPYADGETRSFSPRMHTGIFLIPVCKRGLFQSLTVCIMNLCAYGDSGFLSPYAKFCIWVSPYAYGEPQYAYWQGSLKFAYGESHYA